MEQKIKDDLKQAQLDRDELRVSTLRLLLSELTNAKIQKGQDLNDQDLTQVLRKEAKKRKEAAESFKKGGRGDSASKEEAELKILENYLPAEMPDEELTKIVESSINEVGASTMSDMGKVISLVMSKTQGSVEGGRVSGLIKEKLQS